MKGAALALAAAVALATCGTPADPPEREPYIRGQVTAVEADPFRILVEERPDVPVTGADPGGKIYLSIPSGADVLVDESGRLTAGDPGDIVVGTAVDAWVTGPILESYPEQGTAEAIVVRSLP